jgi:dihydroneopterin aldolase
MTGSGALFTGLDRIAITGIRARGHHGVFEHERVEGQTFLVDVVLGVNTRVAAASDDLADTVDYGAVAALVVAEITGEPRNLIETVAAQIADGCLAQPRVTAVQVTVHKPDAPIGVAFDDVAVTVERRR